MHFTRHLIPSIAALALVGFSGWYSALLAIPNRESDRTFETILTKRGGKLNVLKTAALRYAPDDLVGLANADIMTRATVYDLSQGPILFEADVPKDLKYWSVSVFARNTDTIFVANDQKTGPGPFRLLVRKSGQRSDEKVSAEAISPSNRGYLLVRAVMKDRSDPADVERSMAAVAAERVTVVPDTAAR